MTEPVLQAVAKAQAVVAAIYVIPTAGKIAKSDGGLKNSVSLSDASGTLLEEILARAKEKTVVLAMGNPYLAEDFPMIENYICAFSNASVSEISAVKAIFGEIPIRGHLPVNIPGIAERGAGLERPQSSARGGR
jgi:beta-N-acetylhexosaminidase